MPTAAAPPQVVPTPTADPSAPARSAAPDPLTGFRWEPQPKAEAFVKGVVDELLRRVPEANAFADRLHRESGNRFVDLVCEIEVPASYASEAVLEDAGWTFKPNAQGLIRWNRSGIFPSACVSEEQGIKVGFKVDSVIDFLAANDLQGEPLGELGSPYNSVVAFGGPGDDDDCVNAVEMHGERAGMYTASCGDLSVNAFLLAQFRTRPRRYTDDQTAYNELSRLIDAAVADVGQDVACDLFFAAEREYWERRNAAARFQKARQDRLGIGWANHDHHTYRSSRASFHRLCGLWEKLGFECRERFYPGKHAGWGAQVMEQPVCGIVTFNDVDLSPEELRNDFAHEPMDDRHKLGTVGLWCALHGESVLQAGMHHLECTFDFAALQRQMADEAGIKTMKAFSDYPHLKQAFTEGERWAVDGARIDKLVGQGRLDPALAETFRRDGAIGSHLENLERNAGFKGFNQTGVDEIIAETDPRLQAAR